MNPDRNVSKITVEFSDGSTKEFVPVKQVSVDVPREFFELEKMKDGRWRVAATKSLLEAE